MGFLKALYCWGQISGFLIIQMGTILITNLSMTPEWTHSINWAVYQLGPWTKAVSMNNTDHTISI